MKIRNPHPLHPLRGKSEILTRCAGNPKSEIRNPKEISNRNTQIQNLLADLFQILSLVF